MEGDIFTLKEEQSAGEKVSQVILVLTVIGGNLSKEPNSVLRLRKSCCVVVFNRIQTYYHRHIVLKVVE